VRPAQAATRPAAFRPGLSFPLAIGRTMKKLTLQIQELSVQSFPTSTVEEEIGTVLGQEVPTPPYKTCQALTRMTYDCPCTPMA
jgi:hypothetical protein